MTTRIEAWLAALGLAQYARAFEANDLDVDLLDTLSDADLVSVGVVSLGHRRRILGAASRAPEAVPRVPPGPRTTATATQRDVAAGGLAVGASMASALAERGYQLVDRLGHGGMGEVYRARQIGVDREVAVKVLRAREGEAERARFAREAKAIAALRHPHTVRLFDYLVADDGSACIVMEHVAGESLWALLARERRLGFERMIPIAMQIADALTEAHAKGIVHRDLKPGNVLLQDVEGYGDFAKVLDFGLARRTNDEESRLTHTGTVHGTPRYLSPEQILGTEVGPASDLYSLGVTIYEALAGQPPFVADVDAALLFKHMKETAPPLPTEIERPSAFDGLLERLLAKSPTLRPASASALRRELAGLVRNTLDVRGATREPASTAVGTERRALLVVEVTFRTADGAGASDDDRHELLRRAHALVDGIARRVGATLHARGADSVQLVVGAPIARQHESRRALQMALELSTAIAAIDGRLDVRVGVADGVAIAGPIRAGEPGYLVSGPPVGRASELAASAARGEIAITETLAERAEGLAVERRAGGMRLVGRDGARTQASGSLPFVGRNRELAALRGWIEETRASGTGRIVLITGEAGIGKSRLVDRLVTVARSLGVRTARGTIFDVEVGLEGDALHRIVGELVDLPDDASDRAAALERRLGPTALRADQWPFLYHFLGLGLPGPMQRVYDAMDARTRLAGVQATIAALALHEARTQPLVVVVEDVHWADGAMLEAVEALATVLGRGPLLLVLTARREDEERFRHVLLGHVVERLELEPLGEAEALALAAELGVGMDANREAVVARAGGHPLLLTELARRPEGDAGALPTDVRGLVQARIDRLGERDRGAIFAAAVLGPMLSAARLADLVGEPGYVADALVEHRLLRRENGALSFVHALVRDAVYEALVAESRRALHLRAADVVAGDPALRAVHLDRADASEAASAYLAAARREIDAHRYADARKHLVRGLGLARSDDERWRLTEALAALELEAFDPRTALEHYRSLAALARDDAEHHRASLGVASALRATSQGSDEALEALSRAEDAASRAGIVSSEVHSVRGGVLFATGQLEASRSAHERALAIARDAGDLEREARALSGIADAHYGRGRILEAMRTWEACVALGREADLLGVLATNLPMLAMMKVFANEAREASTLAEQGLVLARELSRPRAEALARGAASFAARVLGEPEDAARHAREGIELSRRLTNVAFEETSRYYLAEALMLAGRDDEARSEASAALSLAREHGTYFVGATLLGLASRLTSEPREARAMLDELEMLLAGGALSFNRFWAREGAIETALRLGDAELARRHADLLLAEDELPPWPRVVGERGLLLARVVEGERSAALETDLASLRTRAAAASLGPTARSLDLALRKLA